MKPTSSPGIKAYIHPELRERSKGLKPQTGGRQCTERWKEQMFPTKTFAMPCKDNGAQKNFISGPCGDSPPSPNPNTHSYAIIGGK